jgi:hypothetical protein
VVSVPRRLAIAFSSLVIGWLAVSLVAGVLFRRASAGNAAVAIIAIILGGLIYADIIRRIRPAP